ncbi:hypothetical protein IAT38_005284 [Cryptococcus sp. DSM 104549]
MAAAATKDDDDTTPKRQKRGAAVAAVKAISQVAESSGAGEIVINPDDAPRSPRSEYFPSSLPPSSPPGSSLIPQSPPPSPTPVILLQKAHEALYELVFNLPETTPKTIKQKAFAMLDYASLTAHDELKGRHSAESARERAKSVAIIMRVPGRQRSQYFAKKVSLT